jgi:hypothetical protein
LATKHIGDKKYWLQNISATKHISDKTYRWTKRIGDKTHRLVLKKVINLIQTFPDKYSVKNPLDCTVKNGIIAMNL